jgi:hypothetical protein
MNWMRKALVIPVGLVALVACALPGCAGGDNPAPKPAAGPVAPPKEEELKVPKTSAGKGTYGASSKYQNAMKKFNKVE